MKLAVDNHNSRRVLIVDDEIDICLLVSSHLRQKGYTVKFANTISAGETILQDFKPDAILLDMNLPDGSGLNLIPSIKQYSSSSKIVVISAYDLNNNSTEQDRKNIDTFIPKPFSLEAISSTLSAMQLAPQAQPATKG